MGSSIWAAKQVARGVALVFLVLFGMLGVHFFFEYFHVVVFEVLRFTNFYVAFSDGVVGGFMFGGRFGGVFLVLFCPGCDCVGLPAKLLLHVPLSVGGLAGSRTRAWNSCSCELCFV